MGGPAAHLAKLHSTNIVERLNGKIKRRTDVIGIFPDEEALVRLVGAILLEQNDEWAVQRSCYMIYRVCKLRIFKWSASRMARLRIIRVGLAWPLVGMTEPPAT